MPGVMKPASQQIEKNISAVFVTIHLNVRWTCVGANNTWDTSWHIREHCEPPIYLNLAYFPISVYTLWNNSHTYCTDVIKAMPRTPRSLLVWSLSTRCCHPSTKYCSHGKGENDGLFCQKRRKWPPTVHFYVTYMQCSLLELPFWFKTIV